MPVLWDRPLIVETDGNWALYSEPTQHMALVLSSFFSGLLRDRDELVLGPKASLNHMGQLAKLFRIALDLQSTQNNGLYVSSIGLNGQYFGYFGGPGLSSSSLNYPSRDPKCHGTETIRPLIEVQRVI